MNDYHRDQKSHYLISHLIASSDSPGSSFSIEQNFVYIFIQHESTAMYGT
jgi:hypothetical protein